MNHSDIDFLIDLEAVIHERIENGARDSYTAQLVTSGHKRIAQKVGEEGVELALAGAAENAAEIVDEAADLIYHVMVLLAAQGLSLGNVAARLKTRHSTH